MVNTNPLFQESIDFINKNINALTSEIPKHLLEYWYISEDITNYCRNDTSLDPYLVFLHALETYNKTLGKDVKLSSLNNIAMFGLFQIIIGIELGVGNSVKRIPINLFDFESYPKQIAILTLNGYL